MHPADKKGWRMSGFLCMTGRWSDDAAQAAVLYIARGVESKHQVEGEGKERNGRKKTGAI